MAHPYGDSPLRDGRIQTHEIADGAITSEKLAPGAVTGADLADGSVTEDALDSDVAAKLMPDAPETDGTYFLAVKVEDGEATATWNELLSAAPTT